MAEIYPFETKQARANRLAQQNTEPVETGVVPTVTDAIEGGTPLFLPSTTTNQQNFEVGDLPHTQITIQSVDKTNIDACATLIKSRALVIMRSLQESYVMTYGHMPTAKALELYTTVADLVALIDCQELLGVAHPYTDAFNEFLKRTK